MTPKQFVEKAVQGGLWEGRKLVKMEGDFIYITHDNPKGTYMIPIDSVFLDPKAWKAVGKVEGWNPEENSDELMEKYNLARDTHYIWQHNMHRMIDVLCEDKTIEQFLETL